MKPPFSGRAARIAKGKEIVAKQSADEPGGDAGARMQTENKRINGQPPSREGGTPKTPTPPPPPEGGKALLQSMARTAARVEPKARRSGPTHQRESGLQNRHLLSRLPSGGSGNDADKRGYRVGAHGQPIGNSRARRRGVFPGGSGMRRWS